MSAFSSNDGYAKKSHFLEAVGISTAVGATLGASTLPFYDEPGDHLANIFYGAGAGLIVGLGIWAYGLLFSARDEEEVGRRHKPSESNWAGKYARATYRERRTISMAFVRYKENRFTKNSNSIGALIWRSTSAASPKSKGSWVLWSPVVALNW